MKFLSKFFKKHTKEDPNDIEFSKIQRRSFLDRSMWQEFATAGALSTNGVRNKDQLNINSNIPFLLNRDQLQQACVIEKISAISQMPTWINYSDFQWMFTRNPIGFNVCTTFPKYCWNPRPVVLEMGNITNTPQTDFELVCAEIADKVNLFDHLEKVDIAAQIGQYGVIYIDFNDDGNSGDSSITDDKIVKYNDKFKNPITNESYEKEPEYLGGLGPVKWEALKGKGADAINYVVVYQQANAWPTAYDDDSARPCYSLVSYYNLQSGGQVFGASGQTQNIVYGAALPVTWNVVHASRCVHVADRKVSNNILGIPAMQPIFNDLLSAYRVSSGSSMVFQNNARGGIAVSIDQKDNQSLAQEDVDAFKAQIDAYLESYSRALVFEGMDAKTLNFEVHDPDKHMTVYLQNISAGCQIPARILLGSEQGKLASTQDKINFDSRVKTRQQGYCSEMVRQFFDRLIANEVIPKPKSGTYKVHFPLLDISDDSENAANFNSVTLGLSALANAKSTEVESEIDSFVGKAKEILKIKGESIDIPVTTKSYRDPTMNPDDLYLEKGDSDAIQAI